MSSIERIILGAPIQNIYQEWIFRKKLFEVLREGLIVPRADMNFQGFITKYLNLYANKNMLPALLKDSIDDYRHAYRLGRLSNMDKYIKSFF
ncbi:hypothetical protein F0919_17430 [Taibaiella lutea]|uniref:Uncharacterized protein n=1 Tax=Taibaiella lutea TaxID=2608001 RepID=A0A5M6CBN6_9BACT|nr:hypothetical protein [Taibaiella lutea]KAA5532564.1 hypothetical protein F0919_17430 [Taibaiella lutea]